MHLVVLYPAVVSSQQAHGVGPNLCATISTTSFPASLVLASWCNLGIEAASIIVASIVLLSSGPASRCLARRVIVVLVCPCPARLRGRGGGSSGRFPAVRRRPVIAVAPRPVWRWAVLSATFFGLLGLKRAGFCAACSVLFGSFASLVASVALRLFQVVRGDKG